MATRGRPRREGPRFKLAMDPDLAERLDKYIESLRDVPGQVTKTSVINLALRKFLDEVEKKFEERG